MAELPLLAISRNVDQKGGDSLESSGTEKKPMEDYDRKLQLVQSLTLFDDIFFSAAMQYTDSCQEVLRVFTGIEDLVVTEVTTQKSIRGAAGHSVTLDMLASDSQGRLYDIEVQLKHEEDYPQRMRYYAAMVDSAFLDSGEKYGQLPELYQITLSRKDYFHGGQPKYEVTRWIRELDREMDNGMHEIYINAENTDGSLLSELMQLFASLRTEDPAFPALSQRIQQYKVEEEGVRHMSELIEAYAYEKEMRGIEKGREEGHKEEKYTMIRNAFKAGVPVETIAQFAKLSEQEVREIIMGA